MIARLFWPIVFVAAPLVLSAGACSGRDLEPGSSSESRSRPAPAEVVFENGDTRLAGSLYRPEGAMSPPAVVILGGSDRGPRGPQKRHLARYLADHGIAALIYDSPGTGHSGGKALVQRRHDRVVEARAAARFLRSVGNVDSTRVGLVGGSEGAVVALLAAGADHDIAYAVLVSGGFGVPMMERARYRIDSMGRRRGLTPDQVDRAQVLDQLLYALFTKRDLPDESLVREKVASWPDEPWNGIVDLVTRNRASMSDQEKEAAWNMLSGALRGWRDEPWFQVAVVDQGNLARVLSLDATAFFSLLDRGPLAAGDDSLNPNELALMSVVHCPILAVWGKEDDFLPPARCAAWLESTLGGTGRSDLTVKVLPGADHVMGVPGSGGATFAPGYPQVIVDWIRDRARTVGEGE